MSGSSITANGDSWQECRRLSRVSEMPYMRHRLQAMVHAAWGECLISNAIR